VEEDKARTYYRRETEEGIKRRKVTGREKDSVEEEKARTNYRRETGREEDSMKEKNTNQSTPWSLVLPEKPLVAQLLKNLATFYGIQKSIAIFITARH
jgi:hypothetical protein